MLFARAAQNKERTNGTFVVIRVLAHLRLYANRPEQRQQKNTHQKRRNTQTL